MPNGTARIKATTCKWSLTWNDLCNTDLYNGLYDPINSLDRQEVYFSLAEPEKIRKGNENGFGQTVYAYTKQRSLYSISMIVDQAEYENIHYIGQFNDVKLINNTDVVEYILDPHSIDIQGQGGVFDQKREVIITFAILDTWSVGNECCDSAYENSPFGDGGGIGNQGASENEPAVCDLWGAVLNTDNLPLLSIVENDIPADSSSVIEWYLNGNFVGEGSQISIGDFGTYSFLITRTVTGEAVPCTRTDAYIHLDACSRYDILINVLNGTITGNVVGVPDGDEQTVEVIDSEGVVLSEELPYTPEFSGTYTVKYDSGDCGEKMRAVIVTVQDENTATHTVTVTNVSGVLTCTINNPPVGTPVHTWTKIDENKNEVVVGTDSSTYTPSTTAIYKCTVAYGADTAFDEILFITGLEVKIINDADCPVVTSEVTNREPVILTYDGSGGTNELLITGEARDLPHPTVFNTETGMKSRITVVVNNIEYNYDHDGYDHTDETYDKDLEPLGSTSFGIDKANDKIVFSETIPPGETIVVYLN